MRLQRSFFVFLFVLMASTASHAYVGLKLGAFNSDGNTNFGGGLVVGIPVPVTGLAIEGDLLGFYDNGAATDVFFLQAGVGPVFDFNNLITPDSDLLHPYVRAGLGWGFVFYSDNTFVDNQNAPGFYSGLGLNVKLPVVTLGIEGNYNYFNFDAGTSADYWNVFWSIGIRL